jgi:ribosomal protein S18 acetylase RimI-like enzyme
MGNISADAASLKDSVNMMSLPGSIVRLSWDHRDVFVRFLADIEANGDHTYFHPHGFDTKAADIVVGLAEFGSDEYWLIVAEGILAYGMLRGWAEGYVVPSLGIAVAPQHRCRGLARRLMSHLHARAFDRGARQVRLKVNRNNRAAQQLYERLGYEFQDYSSTELVGFMKLAD